MSEVPNVVVAEGLGIQVARLSLATVRLLDAAGYGVTVVTADPASLAAASRAARRTVPVSPADPAAIAAAAAALVDDGSHLVAFAAADNVAIALDPWKREWLDKRALAERTAAAGLPMPSTVVFDDLEALVAAADDLEFPVFVKPAMGTVGALCRSPADLPRLEGHAGALLVQPYLRGELRAVGGVMWDGRLVASVHQRTLRTLPVTGGVATAAVTTAPDRALEDRLVDLLREVDGIFQVQLLEGRVIDVNLRPYGSIALAARAGADLPAIVCALVRGRTAQGTVRARPAVRYRWLEGELRRFRALGPRGIAVREVVDLLRPAAPGGVGSLRDPWPMVVRARRAIAPLPPPAGSPGAIATRPQDAGEGFHGDVIVAGALGDRLSLATLRALADGGYRTTLVTSTPGSPAAASRACHELVVVAGSTPVAIGEATRELLESGRYLAAFPGNDRVMLELEPWKRAWTDKEALAQQAAAAGVRHPASTVYATFDELMAAADELPYPCWIKPALGRAGARCDGPQDLSRLDWIRTAAVVQPVLDGTLRAVSGVLWRGEIVAIVHHRSLRTMPPGGGVTTAAVTVEPDLDLEREAVRLLHGVDGIFQVQYLGGWMIDVNLRCFGSLPLAVKSGANLPTIAADLLRGAGPDGIVRGRPGVRYRWPQGEIRHVRARIAGRAIGIDLLDALMPRPSAATGSMFSLRDPGPLLARVRRAARA